MTLTPNQVVAFKLEEARAAKRWTQMETVQQLGRFGLQWSRAAYAMAVASSKGKPPARFDADQLIAFARTFGQPATWFLLPPLDWRGQPAKVRLSKKSGGGTLDDRAMSDLVVGSGLPPEPRSEEERRRQRRESERIIEQVMQFAHTHRLLPPLEPPTDYPPEVLIELQKVVARVLRKHKLLIQQAPGPRPSRGQLDMLTKALEAGKENKGHGDRKRVDAAKMKDRSFSAKMAAGAGRSATDSVVSNEDDSTSTELPRRSFKTS